MNLPCKITVCLLPLLFAALQGPLRAADGAGASQGDAAPDLSAFVVFEDYLRQRQEQPLADEEVTADSLLLSQAPLNDGLLDAGDVQLATFFTPMPRPVYPTDRHYFQLLPDGLIYKSYLAGVKESRMSAHLIDRNNDGFIWDATLGGRVGIMRFGTSDPVRPAGWQLDVEGSAQARLDIDDDVDVRSVDFRGGVLLTYGDGWTQTKFGYYHLSSHLGDEFLLKFPNYPRINFARDVIVLGRGLNLTDEFRVYAELGYAFYTKVSKPWEFQFGLDYAPAHPTGARGAPFVALNGHLREDVDFGGNFTVQGGWAWRGDASDNLLRAGIHFYNGQSPQYSFYNDFEQQIGFGLWYDY